MSPPHLAHSPAQLYTQARGKKTCQFWNPSTLQKCSAGKKHSSGTPSFRMVLKTVGTQLCFCLFSSSTVTGWLQRERRRKKWFSYTASGTLLSSLHGTRCTKPPINDIQILSVCYWIFSKVPLCCFCDKKHKTMKKIALDFSKICCSPMQARPCNILLENTFQAQRPGCHHIHKQDSLVPHTN